MRQIILIFLLFISAPAKATPPDALSLHDQVIGYSETQVFILRETNDNLGLHIFGLHDVLLVAKSLSSGLDEEIWPVYRVYSDGETSPQTDIFRLQNAVNPFEILTNRAAIFVGRDFLLPSSSRASESELDEVVLRVADARLEAEAMLGQISQSIKLTSTAIQPYPEGDYPSMSFHTPQELLAEMSFMATDCYISGLKTLFRYPLKNTSLARIACEDDNGAQVTLVVVLPN